MTMIYAWSGVVTQDALQDSFAIAELVSVLLIEATGRVVIFFHSIQDLHALQTAAAGVGLHPVEHVMIVASAHAVAGQVRHTMLVGLATRAAQAQALQTATVHSKSVAELSIIDGYALPMEYVETQATNAAQKAQ